MSNLAPKDWTLAVDLGTTFSAVALRRNTNSTPHCIAGEIYTVNRYPSAGDNGTRLRAFPEVPSDLRYENCYIRWGFEVLEILKRAARGPGHRINHFKLLLDDHPTTLPLRIEVENARAALPGEKTGEAIITDYLTLLFKHVKSYMGNNLGFQAHESIEMVCTVPAMWNGRQSTIRKIVEAVQNARQSSGFGDGDNIKDVYVVSEPEAAAAYMMLHNPNLQLKKDDVFVVCDAGGGTVDLVTYKVTNTDPLRLREAVKGQGGLCGSSYLNERFRAQLQHRLRDETYLDDDEMALSEKIEAAVNEFDTKIKRDFGGSEDYMDTVTIMFPGLKRDDKKNFLPHNIIINHAHLQAVFRPVVDQVWQLIWSQIREAQSYSLEAKMLLVVGGFAGSPYLQKHIKQNCETETPKILREPIKVVLPTTPCSAIAHGAILRALNKEEGPDRISRSSIGVSQHEELIPESRAHKHAVFEVDEMDGKKYVQDCIDWDHPIPSEGPVAEREFHRTIQVTKEKCLLHIPVYVSDKAKEDHYPITHEKNKDCKFWEELNFEIDANQLAKLPRYPKRPHPRRAGVSKGVQVAKEQLRRSSRIRQKSPGKVGRPQRDGANRESPIIIEDSCKDLPISHEEGGPSQELFCQLQELYIDGAPNSSLPEAQIARGAELSSGGSSERQQDARELPQQYIRIDYKLIVEVSGLQLKYRLECKLGGKTVGNKSVLGLAAVFDPGTA